MSDRVRHCDFYRYTPGSDDSDAYVWVHSCCGGPWEERPYGHYAYCANAGRGLEKCWKILNRKKTP